MHACTDVHNFMTELTNLQQNLFTGLTAKIDDQLIVIKQGR